MKWLVALGCYGLMVASASAGERWPPGPCKDLAHARQVMEKGPASRRAENRFGLLLLQGAHCGVSVQAELDADARATSAGVAPRQPVFCDTTKKAFGGSYVDCF